LCDEWSFFVNICANNHIEKRNLFGDISNADIRHYCREHPREIGERLKALVDNGWLLKNGHGRGSRYRLAGTKISGDLFAASSEHYGPSSEHYGPSSEHYGPSSEHYGPSSEHYAPSSEHYAPSSEHYGPSSEHYEALKQIAAPVRNKGRAPNSLVRQIILELCKEDYLHLRILAELLGREMNSIRNHYISPMLAEKLLELRYPGQLNHPAQAYKTVREE
jgi:ATP-dependent DNA helicase RecG